MNNIQKTLIALIRNAVCGGTGEIRPLTYDEMLELCKLAAEHDMLNVAGKALLDANLVSDGELVQQLLVEQYGGVLRYQQQKYAMERICEAFTDAQIRYVLLKGAVIRDLYPEPELRTSSDIDILIDEKNMAAAAEQLQSIGCEYYSRTDHDVSFFTSDGVHIELHHSLVPDRFVFGKPLGDAWQCARLTDGYRYDFSDEFFVYYHFAHMAKHLQNGGFGIRFVLDLWLMMSKMTWDEKKLSSLLREGGIEKMADVVRRLALVWFDGKEYDEDTSLLEEYIFASGIYGTLENNVVISKRKRGGKLGNLLNRVFMPLNSLASQYPKLEKYPWLYPWYFVVRFFRIVFKNRNKAITELKLNQSSDSLNSKKINKLFDMLDIR